jgi:periplasmic protein TonB
MPARWTMACNGSAVQSAARRSGLVFAQIRPLSRGGPRPQTEKPVAMEASREIVTAPRRPDTGRWAICIALALGIHAAAAAALVAHWNAEPDQVANAPLILVELETLPVAPDTKPAEQPPGPQQQQSAAAPERPKPLEKTAAAPPLPQPAEAPPQPAPQKPAERIAALPAEPKAELQVAVPPPKSLEKPAEKPAEKPVEKKLRPRHASLASAPSSAEHRAERAAAPTPGASARNPDAVPSWKSQLAARLERFKRYPSEAQSRGEQGVAQLAFNVDRSGGVHRARIVHSSGSSLLDAATLALVERAAPLPPPPPEISGAQIAIQVPIRYNMR